MPSVCLQGSAAVQGIGLAAQRRIGAGVIIYRVAVARDVGDGRSRDAVYVGTNNFRLIG